MSTTYKNNIVQTQPVRLDLQKSEHKICKILVYGAGVLGSLYAGKLHQAGYEVTLLARGKHLEELRNQGLVLIEDGSSRLEHYPVQVTDCLDTEDAYDLVLVIVRKNQVQSVLPTLAANSATPNVLFLVNNAEGPGSWVDALGRDRVLLGFPGAGGRRIDGIVHYKVTPRMLQATTIGELGGNPSERLTEIAQAFSKAGFPVAISRNMDAWLKTHVALVSPIANAIYMAGGSNYCLAHTRDGLVLMVRAIKESLRVLRALNIPITPAKFSLLEWLPEPVMIAVLQKGFNTPQAELVLARHANNARDEMLVLAEEFRALAQQSGLNTPAIDILFDYIDPNTPTVAEGQAELPLDWRSTIVWTGFLAFVGTFLGWRFFRRKK